MKSRRCQAIIIDQRPTITIQAEHNRSMAGELPRGAYALSPFQWQYVPALARREPPLGFNFVVQACGRWAKCCFRFIIRLSRYGLTHLPTIAHTAQSGLKSFARHRPARGRFDDSVIRQTARSHALFSGLLAGGCGSFISQRPVFLSLHRRFRPRLFEWHVPSGRISPFHARRVTPEHCASELS